jgi:cytochrome c oxidase subunit II
VRRRLLVFATSIAGGLALAAVAAASNGGVGPVPPVSPNGHRIADAYWVILGVLAVVFVVVEAALLTFVVRYRRRGRPRDAEPEQIHGDTRIELTWTVAPVLLIAVIVAFVFYKLPGIKNTPASAANANITVEAHQFYWLFKYPSGRQSINVLTVPKDLVVNARRRSPADVAHSWWVPAFGGKIDAIPGKTNHTWFKAEKAGTYPIRCAEFCGILHTGMRGFVRVTEPRHHALSPNYWQAGVRRRLRVVPTASTAREGSARRSRSSPTLENPEALGNLVRNGTGTMPAVGNTWDDRLVNALARYLRVKLRRSRRWRLTRTPSRPARRGTKGRLRELARHRRTTSGSGILYISTSLRLLRRRRHPRAAHARPARDAERDFITRDQLQRAVHAPRDGDGLPRRRADPRRLRQLPRAA